ncbi:MAG TPA: TolC family protein [Ohtaekwangia sp.]|nr:TolC family protein [Ohtaekwangia sp.]
MKTCIIFLLLLFPLTVFSQEVVLTVDQAIAEALKNNESIKAAIAESAALHALKGASFDLPKTEVALLYGQYNSDAKNDNNITVSQSIPFSVFGSQASLDKTRAKAGELKKSVTAHDIVYQVKQTYHQLKFAKARHRLLLQQDSIYEGFLKSAALRYETGETNLLEKTTAQVQRDDVKNQLRQIEMQIVLLKTQMKTLCGLQAMPDVTGDDLTALRPENIPDTVNLNPSLPYMRQLVNVAERERKVQSSRLAPDLTVGFFSQTLIGTAQSESGDVATKRDRFTGLQVGIALPLWFFSQRSRVRAAGYNQQAQQSNLNYHASVLQGNLAQAVQQLQANQRSLDYYTHSALPNATMILRQSQAAFREGEIGYAEYLMSIRNSIGIQEGHLKTLNDYNQNVLYLLYLTGKQ